jgi:hypothetical protein
MRTTSLACALTIGFLVRCALADEARPSHSPNGPRDTAASTTSSISTRTRLVTEVARELTEANASRYTHRKHVNEAEGVFNFDCSGFVVYALSRAAPEAVGPLRKGSRHRRPLAEDFVRVIGKIGTGKTRGAWQRVPCVRDLEPGDVVAWKTPSELKANGNRNTGHVMIVHGTARQNPREPREFLVPIADSTAHGTHTDDSRSATHDSGLGTGTIGLVIDDDGAPVSYRWAGGAATKAFSTKIVLGRLR